MKRKGKAKMKAAGPVILFVLSMFPINNPTTESRLISLTTIMCPTPTDKVY